MPSVRKKYKHPDTHYAKRFNISTSSVFRYKREGAPLDDDVKFMRWLEPRSHKPKSMRVPGKKMKDLRVEVLKGKKTSEVPEEKEDSPTVKRHLITGAGLRTEIARQEAECAQAYLNYRTKADADEALEAMAWHKIWVAAQEQLRKLCKDVPKSEKDDEKVLPIGDIESAWAVALKEMKTMLENIPATVAIGLVGVTPEQRVQVEQAMMDEVTTVITALREAPWVK